MIGGYSMLGISLAVLMFLFAEFIRYKMATKRIAFEYVSLLPFVPSGVLIYSGSRIDLCIGVFLIIVSVLIKQKIRRQFDL